MSAVAVTEGVTENVSAHLSTDVVCNDCWNGEKLGSGRRWLGMDLHCSTCHSDDHWACFECGTCLPRGSRLDRFCCSNTCRGRARKRREREALERAAWEAENPERAAKERDEREAWLNKMRELEAAIGGGPAARAERKRIAELKAHAERCAETVVVRRGYKSETGEWIPPVRKPCPNLFEEGDVVYRRREHAWDITAAVLPFCHEHRCSQSKGRHNRDARPGRYYPGCCCDDHYWTEPEPCLGCGRLVSHPRNARWRRARDYRYWGETGLPSQPRVFCSEDCKRRVLSVETRSRRLAAAAEREPTRCTTCNREFTPRRPDARYCSSACRQKAYRLRKGGPA